jgi:phosphate transport system protein
MPRQQFHADLTHLQDAVLEMGAMVDRQIERSIQSLVERDTALADAVIRDDEAVNRTRNEIDNHALLLLAQQAPMAGDLRIVISVLSIIIDLERMGDHAKGIGHIVQLMIDEPLVKPLVDIPEMAVRARAMLGNALDAFVARDVEAAYRVGEADDGVDELQDRVYNDLVQIMIKDPTTVEPCTHLLWVAHNLERIADRTTNIAERVVFTATGELAEMDVSSY